MKKYILKIRYHFKTKIGKSIVYGFSTIICKNRLHVLFELIRFNRMCRKRFYKFKIFEYEIKRW